MDRHAQQFFQFDLKPAKIEQRHSRKRINQQVKVAIFAIVAMQGRSEQARIFGLELLYRLAYSLSICFKCFRWFHG